MGEKPKELTNYFVVKIINCRNSATENVEQELLFVGQESGKLLAVRNLIQQVQIA